MPCAAPAGFRCCCLLGCDASLRCRRRSGARCVADVVPPGRRRAGIVALPPLAESAAAGTAFQGLAPTARQAPAACRHVAPAFKMPTTGCAALSCGNRCFATASRRPQPRARQPGQARCVIVARFAPAWAHGAAVPSDGASRLTGRRGVRPRYAGSGPMPISRRGLEPLRA